MIYLALYKDTKYKNNNYIIYSFEYVGNIRFYNFFTKTNKLINL